MLDQEFRLLAESCCTIARQNAEDDWENKIHYFNQSIAYYSKIKYVTPDDIRDMSARFRDIAIVHFNRGDHMKAGEYYLRSIQQILTIELDDRDYRTLTELYIDLADACAHFHNQPEADAAVRNAMLALNQIKEKTPAEKDIGNPEINFPAFHQYVERKTSTQLYRESARYKNHEKMFHHQLDEQMMAHMLDGFSMSDRPAGPAVSDIEAMMGGLCCLNSAIPNFVPVNLVQPTNDVDFRSRAIEFLRLTQQHIQQNNIKDTIATYRQAREALQLVKSKTAHDLSTIRRIDEHIHSLDMQSQGAASAAVMAGMRQQDQQFSGGLAAAIGMFVYEVKAPGDVATEHVPKIGM